jgi:hypothetical protein
VSKIVSRIKKSNIVDDIFMKKLKFELKKFLKCTPKEAAFAPKIVSNIFAKKCSQH